LLYRVRVRLNIDLNKVIMKNLLVVFIILCATINSLAETLQPNVITIYKNTANNKGREYVAGLVYMDQLNTGCDDMVGSIKIEGLQFSESGVTLEQIRFNDNKGNVFSVPTNIGKLPKAKIGQANNFLRVGKTYFAHMQFCGSGGFGSLINIYDMKSTFGAFD
jgi:hypothetical protein